MTTHITPHITCGNRTFILFAIHCPCGEEARSITFHDNGDTAHLNHGPNYCDMPVDVFRSLFHEIVQPHDPVKIGG